MSISAFSPGIAVHEYSHCYTVDEKHFLKFQVLLLLYGMCVATPGLKAEIDILKLHLVCGWTVTSWCSHTLQPMFTKIVKLWLY